jgi:hypothetical protein
VPKLVTAVSTATAAPASRPPQQHDAATFSSLAANGGSSFSSSMRGGDGGQQASKGLPVAPSQPGAAKSPSRASGSPAKTQRTTWKSQAAVGPPPDLTWSPTVERLIMNSTKQVQQPPECTVAQDLCCSTTNQLSNTNQAECCARAALTL